VEKAKILPPQAQIGPITPEERSAVMRRSVIAGVYEKDIDRESAFEILQARINSQEKQNQDELDRKLQEKEETERAKIEAREEKERAKNSNTGLFGDLTKVVGRTVTQQVGGQLGRALVRGLLGGLFGGKGKKLF
jgi:uncharacterized protein